MHQSDFPRKCLIRRVEPEKVALQLDFCGKSCLASRVQRFIDLCLSFHIKSVMD